jgi:hypothetical protein
MRRAVIIAIGLMLAVTACAAGDVGGEATDPPEPAGTGQSEPAGGGGDADPTEAPTGDSDDPLSGFRDDEASAVVIIGDERYEFDGLRCVTMGGALGAASMGGDPSVNISLPRRTGSPLAMTGIHHRFAWMGMTPTSTSRRGRRRAHES